MLIRQLYDHDSSTYTYLLADTDLGVAALIDPVRGQVERDLRIACELDLEVTHVLDTHVHADHVTGAAELRERTRARTYASAAGAPCVDVHLADGDRIQLGHIRIEVLATPGHTNDSLSYRVPGAVFTGDCLLIRGCGRTDFQNGDPDQLYDSITRVLFALPDDTLVYPAHDYKGRTCTTIGEEKRWNPRIAGKTRAEFVSIMNHLDLPAPRHIGEAIAANLACGARAAAP